MSENTNKKDIIDAEEFAVAEKEAALSTDTYVHKLEKPFEFEGKTYEELTFDWGGLTGEDSLAIENEMQSHGRVIITPEFSGHYLSCMAARACTAKVGTDFLSALPLREFNAIRSKARSFLMHTAL